MLVVPLDGFECFTCGQPWQSSMVTCCVFTESCPACTLSLPLGFLHIASSEVLNSENTEISTGKISVCKVQNITKPILSFTFSSVSGLWLTGKLVLSSICIHGSVAEFETSWEGHTHSASAFTLPFNYHLCLLLQFLPESWRLLNPKMSPLGLWWYCGAQPPAFQFPLSPGWKMGKLWVLSLCFWP